jgi:hypothetical protein
VGIVRPQFIFPPSARRDRPWLSKGNGNGGYWGDFPDTTDEDSSDIRISKSYVIAGNIATSPTIPHFSMPVAGSATLIEVVAFIDSGTSCNIDCNYNGTGIAGLTGLTILPWSGLSGALYVPSSVVSVMNNERFGIVINSVNGAVGLTVNFNFDITPA